jgi:hypothetical protein
VLKKIQKIILIVTLTVLFFIGSLGAFHLGMNMEHNGQMSSTCLMPGMTTMCQMDPLEHIISWQRMVAVAPNQNNILLALIQLLALIFGSLYFFSRSNTTLSTKYFTRSLLSYQRKYIPISNYLQELFANGIIHPKIL